MAEADGGNEDAAAATAPAAPAAPEDLTSTLLPPPLPPPIQAATLPVSAVVGHGDLDDDAVSPLAVSPTIPATPATIPELDPYVGPVEPVPPSPASIQSPTPLSASSGDADSALGASNREPESPAAPHVAQGSTSTPGAEPLQEQEEGRKRFHFFLTFREKTDAALAQMLYSRLGDELIESGLKASTYFTKREENEETVDP
ncbi:hypothetical protein HK405_001812, partial [Cladochytrium tenue]